MPTAGALSVEFAGLSAVETRTASMVTEILERIRARAYQIWEEHGRPEGRHHDHWLQAEQEHVGMMGDGTEEQNLGQPGHPEKRITEAEVKEAFAIKSGS